MTKQEIELIQRAIDAANNRGETNRDEAMLAVIEATLRDLLGQRHGVWRCRVSQPTHGARP